MNYQTHTDAEILDLMSFLDEPEATETVEDTGIDWSFLDN